MQEVDIRYVLEIQSEVLEMDGSLHVDKILFDRESNFIKALNYYKNKGFELKYYKEPTEWIELKDGNQINLLDTLKYLQNEVVKHENMVRTVYVRMLELIKDDINDFNSAILDFLYWDTNIFYEHIQETFRHKYKMRPRDIRNYIPSRIIEVECPFCKNKRNVTVHSKSEKSPFVHVDRTGNWYKGMCDNCKDIYIKMERQGKTKEFFEKF
jgi:hypothetical protein